jgi:hypothetical protein
LNGIEVSNTWKLIMNYGGIGLATCIERPIHLVTAAELVIRL